MLAREYCDDAKRKIKPVVLSHRMMPGALCGRRCRLLDRARCAPARPPPLALARAPLPALRPSNPQHLNLTQPLILIKP
jgi:hypothetical protein